MAEGGDDRFQQVWPLRTLEGLIDNRGSDARPRPAIAESWTVSPDGLMWRLTLRANVLFHDGTRCDANAAKTLLEAALAGPEIVQYPGLLDVKSVRTEGDRVVIIDLRRPSAFLLSDLNIDIAKPSPSKGSKIGTGPYYPTSQSNAEVVLSANAHYSQGAPEIDQLVFRPYPTLRLAWSSLLRGEIDGVYNLSGDALEFLTSENTETFSFPRHYAYVMAFNSQKPQLRSAAVRRALNAAVDRQAIVDGALKGRGKPAYTPIWPGHWAYDDSIPGYSFDPSLARTTLDALQAHEVGRRTTSTPTRLRFTCLVPSNRPIPERIALMLQSQMYDVGVDLALESVSLRDFDKRLRSRDFDAVLLDLASGASLSRVYVFWRSPGEYQGFNFFGYSNPNVDKWLDRLRFAQDDATTRAAASQLQRVLLNDPPGVFVAWSDQTRAVSRRVNVQSQPNQDPFEVLWKWRFEGPRTDN